MTYIAEPVDMDKISIADVALTFPQAINVLKHHQLDYCCSGKRSFREACQKAGADPIKVWQEIQEVRLNHGADNRMRFDGWSVPLLIDFIMQHHHEYVKRTIPQIEQLIQKVCHAHGEDTPSLYSLQEDFADLAKELLDHLPKEEGVLFPAMLAYCSNHADSMDLSGPIRAMEHEHEVAGELIRSIRALTDDYTPPAYACPTFRMTYIMLQQFDIDLMQHIHIENNILFPKAFSASIL